MIDRREIEEFCGRLVREFQPERVVLFGSYAYGRPAEDSDVDLLVIMPFKGKRMRKAAEVLSRISPRIPVDLVVQSPEKVRERLAQGDFFLREIFEKGKVLYDAARP